MIGLDIGEVESEAFWIEFLRSLRARGLDGVRLVVSDHHEGLKTAIARVLGCPWQRCTVHFVRNMHGHCRRTSAAWSPPPCARSSTPTAGDAGARAASPRSSSASRRSRRRSRSCSRTPRTTCSPSTPSRASTGPSCARRTRSSASTARSAAAPTSSASSPTTPPLIRLAGALLIEQNDEWLVSRRYLSDESIALALNIEDESDRQRKEVIELTAA